MNKHSGLFAAIAALCLLASARAEQELPADDLVVATETATPVSLLNAADLEDWLDGYLSASLQQSKIAGAVVSVVKDGRVLLSKGYGLADVENELPMDPARTLVRVGSTSKLFTWTAVMQQVEAGRLDLNADVNEYLDFSIPERDGAPVTMLDLMNHQGGFEEGLREILITDPDLYITTEQMLKAHPRPRIFPAGKVSAYSNYGTALAGYIVERLSGELFEDYIDDRILAPLEMTQSTFRQPLPGEFEADMSLGYMSGDDEPRAFEMVTTAPAGSLSATADDMANFMIMHLQDGRFGDQQILSPEMARLMHSPSMETPPGFATIAHGFFSQVKNGRRVIGHGGDTIVFHTSLELIPEEGVGFFFSFNSRGAQDSVYGVRQRLFDDFMDRYFPGEDAEQELPAIADSIADAEDIAGRYQSSRRIETAFLKMIYLLQQAKIVANDDGTISFESDPDEKYTEVAANLWRSDEDGHELYVTRVDGVLTIIDSDNPSSVLQAVPLTDDGGVTLFVLGVSLGVLVLVLLAWPIGWRYRRLYRQTLGLPADLSRARMLVRVAALADLVYLVGWYFAFQPIFVNELDVYGTTLDALLRTMQFAGVVPLAGAALGVWNSWLTLRSDRHWAAKLGNLLLALALLGVVWAAWAGNLFSFNLEY